MRHLSVLLLLASLPATSLAEEPLRCLIHPHAIVEVSAPVEGLLETVEVDRGDIVRRGQVVARLESATEAANVALARARSQNRFDEAATRTQHDMLKARLARTEALHIRAIVSNAAAEEVRAEAQAASLAVEKAIWERELAGLELLRAEAALEQRTVRSPIDGVVTERLRDAGEYWTDQAHIITIAKLNPLVVEVHAPTGLYEQIKVGTTAEVRPEAPIGGSHSARVVVVDRVFDPASGTFGVRLEMANPDGALPAGIHCTIRFS